MLKHPHGIELIKIKKVTYNLQSVEHKLACQVDTAANPSDMPTSTKFWKKEKKNGKNLICIPSCE